MFLEQTTIDDAIKIQPPRCSNILDYEDEKTKFLSDTFKYAGQKAEF